MNELWIPILGVICAVGMPVLLGIIASYMTIKSKHEEKMAMIEKGIVCWKRPCAPREGLIVIIPCVTVFL